MATYRLTMSLNPASIKQTIKDLDGIKRGWNMKAYKVCRLAAEALAEFINGEWSVGVTGYIGDIDAYAYAVPLDRNRGYKIVASGEDIYFLEFGTGVFATDSIPSSYGAISVPVGPGTYSQSVGSGQFIKGVKEYWFWNHQWINGSLPAFAFDKARAQAGLILASAIKEVFG